jgi:hypothetical protein
MWLDLNGKRVQTGNTKTMIFSVAKIVSYVSQFMTLMPGDVITTGTPPGVGLGMKPPVFLKKGDVMTLGIEGLGEQRQVVVPFKLKLAQAKDIVDTAVAAGNFKTLATALQAAGLVDTLKGKGPFTVFAPTDAAFAKIPKADLDALLKDKAKLTAVLTYHVVPGKVMAKDVKAGKVKTVQGGEMTVATTGGVTVDGAKVVKPPTSWPTTA